ncbi:MAG: dehydrogenase [Burkholderiales bacterium]|nr:dehydrogenase [Burkholderiales bacterium]
MRAKVVLVGGIYHADAGKQLRAAADVVALDDPSPAEIAAALANAHGAIVRYPHRIDATVLAGAQKLAVVASSGRGTDSIDVAACTKHGVAVVNNPGLGTIPVSEHAIGMMLSLSRRLELSDRTLRAGGAWAKRTALDVRDVNGRTLGVIGLGLIGSEMTRKCIAAFGMKVLVYDPHVPASKAEALGATMLTDLGALLERADVVSIHAELNEGSRGMIGEAELRRMQPHAILINTARGKIVQQKALERALAEGRIDSAALDVFEEEPLAEPSPLWDLDNLMLTPHVAGLSGDALRELAHSAVTQVLQVLGGEHPRSLVNPPAWNAAMARLGRAT